METSSTNRSNNRGLLGLLSLIIIGLLIFAFWFRGPIDDGPEKTEITPPEQAISIEEAKVLQQEFVRTRAGIINDSLFKDSKEVDTRDFWFSLETIEQYVAYVKSEGANKGYKDMGIRIFFAAYPKNSRDPRADPGFSTVILAPTKGKPPVGNGFFPMAPIQDPAGGIQALNYSQGGKPPKNL